MRCDWPWPEQPPLVLAVDDREPSLSALGRVLSEAGCDVMPAGSADRALQRLEAAAADVVVVDRRMRPQDGLQVLRRIRAEPRWRCLPVLVMLPEHERPCVPQLLQAGADDTLCKPIQASELVARVRTLAELHRRRRAA